MMNNHFFIVLRAMEVQGPQASSLSVVVAEGLLPGTFSLCPQVVEGEGRSFRPLC